MVNLSELDFSNFLPISGSCQMDINGQVTDLPGSQMCISSDSASIAHYRIIAAPNINISIQVNSRNPVSGDGVTFSPIGQITSDVQDITIIPGTAHITNTGTLGRIEIRFGGQIVVSRDYAPNGNYEIEMEDGLTWLEVP
jgi:hypothetical protein